MNKNDVSIAYDTEIYLIILINQIFDKKIFIFSVDWINQVNN